MCIRDRFEAERLRETGAGVVGSAAADREDERPDAALQGREDQLARATRGRDARVALERRHQPEAARGRHLDDRHTIGKQSQFSLHRTPQRAGDGCLLYTSRCV